MGKGTWHMKGADGRVCGKRSVLGAGLRMKKEGFCTSPSREKDSSGTTRGGRIAKKPLNSVTTGSSDNSPG